MSQEPQALRMLRISSDLLPVRTFDRYQHLYTEQAVVRSLDGFQEVGDLARKYDIRLSTHPGQYTLLTSSKQDVIDRSIQDLEYHAEIFRLMGYDSSDQRQEINIHGGAKCSNFVERFMQGYARLSWDCQQWLSVENDEFNYGLDDILPLSNHVKICVDINHYWIKEGQYLDPNDSRLSQVVDSWRGARPEIHVAWPHEKVLSDHVDPNSLPVMSELEKAGFKRSMLRAHSNDAWHPAISHYALTFWHMADLCVESKFKNLASKNLYQIAVNS